MGEFIKGFFTALSKVLFGVKIINDKKLRRLKNTVIVANHLSAIDGFILWCITPVNTCILAKRQIFLPVIGTIFKKVGLVPLNRNSQDIHAIKHAISLLKDGNNIFLFPEGTRNGLKKGLKPKMGAIYMANAAGSSIVPVYISDHIKLFGHARVVVGDSIKYAQVDKTDKEYFEKCTDDMMGKIFELGK